MKEIELSKTLPYGILNWYPFQKGSVVGFWGNTPEGLEEEITSRGPVMSQEGPWDYIIAYRLLEEAKDPKKALEECKSCLKADGHLLLVCENRLGLHFFLGDKDPFTKRIFDGLENYRDYDRQELEERGGRCYARYEIESFLHQAGFVHTRGYSVLPGLEMPQQLYAWDYLPEENLAIRYTPLYHDPSAVFMREENIYESTVSNGMFHQMANAYLIDCALTDHFYEICHVTTSMDRGREHALATIIQRDGKVIKKAMYPQGNARIENLYRNSLALQERGFAIIPQKEVSAGTYEGWGLQGVVMPYHKAPTVIEYLRRLIFTDSESFITETCRFLDMILRSSKEGKRGEDPELGPIYQEVFLDLVPLNCFYENGTYLFYDQELCLEQYPIRVLLTRTIDMIYMGNKDMENLVPSSFFRKRYGLEQKIGRYRMMEEEFLATLRKQGELADYLTDHMADKRTLTGNRVKVAHGDKEYLTYFTNLFADIEEKSLYLFGSGRWAKRFFAEFGSEIPVEAILDNQTSNWGTTVEGVEVRNPDVLKNLAPERYKVIICVKYYESIVEQLKELGCRNYGIYDPRIEHAQPLAESRRIPSVSSSRSEKEKKPYEVGYVAGVFDLFHQGHLNLLKKAKEQCRYLIVGVVSDEQAGKDKARGPYVSEEERKEIVAACRYVDEAFVLPVFASATRDVYKKYHFDVQFSGSDYEQDSVWLKEQAWLRKQGSELVFFPYTQTVSSTKRKRDIEQDKQE